MNVKLRVLSAGVLFFIGHTVTAQKKKDDTTKVAQIEEVVVLGYSRTATKPKDLTASVNVSGEKMENRPNVSFLNSLQGEAPGLTISSTSGQPGSAKIDVIIRGVSTINSLSDPLYVIDGFTSNSTQYRNLNPTDIESITVLKDAAGAAVYGNRGANGVIVIKTKQGKFGSKFGVSYNGTTGLSFLPTTNYNIAGSRDLLRIQRSANSGLGAGMTDQQIDNFPIDTDWRKVFFRAGFTQNHDLGLSFGGQNVNNYSSIGYMDQTGVVPQTDFQRFTFRNNLNGRSNNEKFTYGANIGLGFSKRHQLDQETRDGINSNVIQNPLLGANVALPTLASDVYSNGQSMLNAMGSNYGGGNNVYVLQDVMKGTLPNLLTETSILTNIQASYKLTPSLTLTNKSGIDYKLSERTFARAPWSYLGLVVAFNANTEFGGVESITKTRELNFNSITSLNYSKVFNDVHTFNVGAYFDYLKVHYNGTAQTQNGLNPLQWVFGAGTGYVPFSPSDPQKYIATVSASKITAGTLAYFATLNYDYADKYGFEGVIRRDGSYRFIDDYKWGTFWSLAGRWNIDKEAFMENSTFDMLKLRASYGKVGNQNVLGAAYDTNPLLVGTNLVRDTNTIGLGYNNINGSYYTNVIANTETHWEEIYQLNLGLDFRFWKRKFEGSLDVYQKKTKELYNDINLSAITGLYNISGNNGVLENKGVEALLKYHFLKNENYSLTIYANGAYNENKILDLIKNDETGNNRNVVGGSVYEWYLVPYAGVNQDNGNLLFYDANGNVTEDPNVVSDQVKTGKNYIPKWQGGFGLNSTYKGFFLDVHFSYQQGAWKYDNQMDWLYDATTVADYNVSADLLNAWTPTNTNTNIPSLTADNYTYVGSSDRFLRDASFVRLKNVILGYVVPKEKLSDTGLKGLKLFLQGENLLTFTKWKGYDPEPSFATSTSVYPNMRTVSLGINVDF